MPTQQTVRKKRKGNLVAGLELKLDNALATNANILAGGDMGCLMNIAGIARRQGKLIEVRHIAELLAQDLAEPAIGEGNA